MLLKAHFKTFDGFNIYFKIIDFIHKMMYVINDVLWPEMGVLHKGMSISKETSVLYIFAASNQKSRWGTPSYVIPHGIT